MSMEILDVRAGPTMPVYEFVRVALAEGRNELIGVPDLEQDRPNPGCVRAWWGCGETLWEFKSVGATRAEDAGERLVSLREGGVIDHWAVHEMFHGDGCVDTL